MDPDTFFSRVRKFLIELLKKELRMGAIRSQAMVWIRFKKDRELVELAFNSKMVNVYNLSDMNKIVNEMIAHMKQQIENPALLDSRFVFDEVLHMDVDFHRLNLTIESSYLPLPDWLAKKKAIITAIMTGLQRTKYVHMYPGQSKKGKFLPLRNCRIMGQNFKYLSSPVS